ncbi:ribonucleoside triphosphate reductase, partial [Patescibacteria group bacterium]|nr:ribonucleoside triphosphate reductase [Patescibacteria group bacterium]
MKQQITKIKKRDGRIVTFKQEKITNAVYKAVTAVSEEDGKLAQKLSNQVVKILNRRFEDKVLGVEDVQDIVEEVLIQADLFEVAKAYILYREQHRKIREAAKATKESLEMIDQYLQEVDWEVKENANMTYSLQGLNNYISNGATKKYWLDKIYPLEIREAAENGDFHIHDL